MNLTELAHISWTSDSIIFKNNNENPIEIQKKSDLSLTDNSLSVNSISNNSPLTNSTTKSLIDPYLTH